MRAVNAGAAGKPSGCRAATPLLPAFPAGICPTHAGRPAAAHAGRRAHAGRPVFFGCRVHGRMAPCPIPLTRSRTPRL